MESEQNFDLVSSAKPQFGAEYLVWLESHTTLRRVDWRSRYDAVVEGLSKSEPLNDFVRKLKTAMDLIASQYRKDTGVELFFHDSAASIHLHYKPYDSCINKSFRKNVFWNKRDWPKPPRGNWITPDNWHVTLDDFVRTQVVVRYVDGAVYLTNALEVWARSEHIRAKKRFVAQEEGYYGAHSYYFRPFSFTDEGASVQHSEVLIEVQVTTQLQESIRSLIHREYDRFRIAEHSGDWKWEFDNPLFDAAYIGHSLRYLEANIVRIRANAKHE